MRLRDAVLFHYVQCTCSARALPGPFMLSSSSSANAELASQIDCESNACVDAQITINLSDCCVVKKRWCEHDALHRPFTCKQRGSCGLWRSNHPKACVDLTVVWAVKQRSASVVSLRGAAANSYHA